MYIPFLNTSWLHEHWFTHLGFFDILIYCIFFFFMYLTPYNVLIELSMCMFFSLELKLMLHCHWLRSRLCVSVPGSLHSMAVRPAIMKSGLAFAQLDSFTRTISLVSILLCMGVFLRVPFVAQFVSCHVVGWCVFMCCLLWYIVTVDRKGNRLESSLHWDAGIMVDRKGSRLESLLHWDAHVAEEKKDDGVKSFAAEISLFLLF